MATALWIDSGIADKMLRIIVAEAVRDDDNAERPYPTIRSDEPLTLMHMITSFIEFGAGIMFAGIGFFGELIYHKMHVKTEGRKVASNQGSIGIEKNQEDIMEMIEIDWCVAKRIKTSTDRKTLMNIEEKKKLY